MEAKYAKAFGRRLRMARIRMGLSQAMPGELLEIHSHAVSNWERGCSTPNYRNLVLLCSFLKVTPNYLLGYPSSKKSATGVGAFE